MRSAGHVVGIPPRDMTLLEMVDGKLTPRVELSHWVGEKFVVGKISAVMVDIGSVERVKDPGQSVGGQGDFAFEPDGGEKDSDRDEKDKIREEWQKFTKMFVSEHT